jgi:hypothetical protein
MRAPHYLPVARGLAEMDRSEVREAIREGIEDRSWRLANLWMKRTGRDDLGITRRTVFDKKHWEIMGVIRERLFKTIRTYVLWGRSVNLAGRELQVAIRNGGDFKRGWHYGRFTHGELEKTWGTHVQTHWDLKHLYQELERSRRLYGLLLALHDHGLGVDDGCPKFRLRGWGAAVPALGMTAEQVEAIADWFLTQHPELPVEPEEIYVTYACRFLELYAGWSRAALSLWSLLHRIAPALRDETSEAVFGGIVRYVQGEPGSVFRGHVAASVRDLRRWNPDL